MINDIIDIKIVGFASPCSIPISVDTNIDLETIVILMTGPPQSAVTIISIPFGRLLSFSKIDLSYSGFKK